MWAWYLASNFLSLVSLNEKIGTGDKLPIINVDDILFFKGHVQNQVVLFALLADELSQFGVLLHSVLNKG